jgi:hypothetical protein
MGNEEFELTHHLVSVLFRLGPIIGAGIGLVSALIWSYALIRQRPTFWTSWTTRRRTTRAFRDGSVDFTRIRNMDPKEINEILQEMIKSIERQEARKSRELDKWAKTIERRIAKDTVSGGDARDVSKT